MRPRDLRLPSRHLSPQTTFLALGLAISLGALSGLAGCGIDTRSVGVMGGANASLGGAANGRASAEAGHGAALAQGGGAGDGALGGATNGGAAGAGAAATGGSGPDAGASPADAGSEPPVVLLPACAEHLLAAPGSVTATTSNATGAFTLSCGSGVSDDVSYYFVAAEAGYYQIDTLGSSLDTTLALFSAACDGTELACNDESQDVPPQSEIVRKLNAAEGVVIVVDGKSGSFGDVVLSVDKVTCPGIDLEQQPLPLESTTLDGTDAHTGSCGGATQREKAFRWQAPTAGLFQFSVSSDAFTPALYLERGARCGGELLGCNTGGFMSPATVVRQLDAAEVVTLWVDGSDGAGAFTLDVQDLSGSASCPNGRPLVDNDEVTATLTPGDPSVLTGSCVPERQTAPPSGSFPLPEHAYPLTINGYACNPTISADGPVAVYVLEGLVCGGAELSCQRIDAAGDTFLDVDLGDRTFSGGTFNYTIVVEATNPVLDAPVTYTLSEACFIP